jgi:hypothetical protein
VDIFEHTFNLLKMYRNVIFQFSTIIESNIFSIATLNDNIILTVRDEIRIIKEASIEKEETNGYK